MVKCRNDPNQQLNRNPKTPFLGTLEEAPEYTISNIYILTGYRINFNKFRYIIKSLFMIHNETLNIWTHIVGN